jgi:hypothetical protein
MLEAFLSDHDNRVSRTHEEQAARRRRGWKYFKMDAYLTLRGPQ